MAKLVNVYNIEDPQPLARRQLPLTVDDTLSLIMDFKHLGLMNENLRLKAKILEDFDRKLGVLVDYDLSSALQVNRSELLRVLNQSVPCVGCRRSVERLYHQLCKFGYPTLDPIVTTPEGIITIRKDKQIPQVICSLFHDHGARLSGLIENQMRRSKKSHRCGLHSLDSQRSRSIGSDWQNVWDNMRDECKKAASRIPIASLYSTLETYLQKHRFCGECRTKVLKAYSLLVEDPEPSKEPGYSSKLYEPLQRCEAEELIIVSLRPFYINELIKRAEPELAGSRRERHAKTIEIAQEEVLTCLGICLYDRLHRISLRIREEECTCRVFAAVAVDALSRNFEIVVEKIQGISQLELLYAELTKEEQEKQIRREQKKLKRKRKKERSDEKENDVANLNGIEYSSCTNMVSKSDDESITCASCNSEPRGDGANNNNGRTARRHGNGEGSNQEGCKMTEGHCCGGGGDNEGNHKCRNGNVDQNYKCGGNVQEKDKSSCLDGNVCRCLSDRSNHNVLLPNEYNRRDNCSSSTHSHDCGYSSEHVNGCCETVSLASSLPSTPDGSELVCSEECCQGERECVPMSRLRYGSGQQLSLQEMLDDKFYTYNDSDCYITAEELREFDSNKANLFEQRRKLRETLQTKFAQLCVYGPLQVPRLLVQSKYASN